MLKQSGIAIPDDEFMEMLYMGSPDILRARYEKQEIRNAALQAKLKEIVSEVDMAMQMKMKEFDMQMQQQMQQAQMQAQQQQQMPQGEMPGQVPAQQSMPMPSDAMTQGQGMDASNGGMPPQQANPEITQAMR